MNETILVVVAFLGNTMAVVVGACLTQRNARRAEENATAAQISTQKAREDAFKAQTAASQAAMALVVAAKATNSTLDHIVSTSDATHKIVNNQRTVMLRAIAVLSRRIADDRPGDEKASQAATDAESDLHDAVADNADPQTKP